MTDSNRRQPPSTARFVRNAEIPSVPVAALEGASAKGATGTLDVKSLLVGENVSLLEFHRGEGRVDPNHHHSDHESICYLVSGRVRVVIDGESFEAGPGDAWIHPAGVPHYHETLEDAVQIEIKSPPMKTWN
jgi:quercetin dioxygenase-like cupin family protein